MYEMELAAQIIAEKISRGDEKPWPQFRLDDFLGNSMAEKGFLHLIAGDWLKSGMYNGNFLPRRKFFERLNMPVPEVYKDFAL